MTKDDPKGLELLTERTPLVKSPGSFYAEVGKLPRKVCRNGSFCRIATALLAMACALVALFQVHPKKAAILHRSSHHRASQDFIHRFPGHSEPLPSEWYSGYLEYRLPAKNNQVVHTHYVYVEAELDDEQQVHDETPVIFWSNGGPGASSLFGLLTEFGPLLLNAASLETDSYKKSGVPTLFRNPHSWNRLGSILILDAPAPVGYSYCDENEDTEGGLGCGEWNDDLAAWNNYHALLAFYEKFPLLKKRPLYLTGQSYAGLYVPMLAKKIVEHRSGTTENEAISNSLPLKGFAVGNPCFGSSVNCVEDPAYYVLFFLAGHGQVSMELYRNAMETCGGEEQLKRIGVERSPECSKLLEQIPKQAGGFFDYNLYNDCPYENQETASRLRTNNIVTSNGLNEYVCGGGIAMEKWVQHPQVKRAMHVPLSSFFFDGDDGVGMKYNQSEQDLSSFYVDLAKGKYADEKLRVLIYDGDADPSINSILSQDFCRELGLQEVESWRPWTIDNCRRMGGYVTRYEGSLDFLTIRGSGHFVPYNKPEAAYTFLKNWIHDQPYPEYDQDCEQP